MATLYHFTPFSSFSSRKPSSFSTFAVLHFHYLHNLRIPHANPTISASSTKKTSSKGKVKSNEDLCKEIKEFLSTFGLPEDYVPAIKEFSQHGRQDLANIVRRRGYKLIKQLLVDSEQADYRNSKLEGDAAKQEDECAVSVISTGAFSSIGASESGDHAEDDVKLNSGDWICSSADSQDNQSIQEKLTRFLRDGDLDSLEDEIEDTGVCIDSRSSVEPDYASMHVKQKNLVLLGQGLPTVFNGNNISGSQEIEHSLAENGSSRREHVATDRVAALDEEDLKLEPEKVDNEAEIDHLKVLLHQKELELKKLQEQIEKEKLALSILQTKAEEEIKRAQQLISEKDDELQAAEETLSGLKEVEILYFGDGSVVEVAGSFNGWHNRIKMDPQPSSNISNAVEIRKSQLWRAVLWLYPGVYEVKFVVDGHWKIDPQREFITRGDIQNNILRVDR